MIADTLTQVEDEFSGIAAVENPPLAFTGRMYPPRDDYIVRNPEEGTLTARTAGHDIRCDADGSITITRRDSDKVEFHRPGRDE